MGPHLDIQLMLTGISFVVTMYFWLIKAHKDKPNLEFYQLSHFRMSSRRHPNRDDMRRVGFQQLDTGGVLIVNHSTRQNSVVLFNCYLKTDQGEIRGDWGYSGDDKPPWNIGPETSIAFSPACFFDVPQDFELPDDPQIRMEFITASGKRFSHRFTRLAPAFLEAEFSGQRAA